jgi:hypothetical protein
MVFGQLSMQSVPITTNFVSSNDEVYSIQYYVIKFVSDLPTVVWIRLYYNYQTTVVWIRLYYNYQTTVVWIRLYYNYQTTVVWIRLYYNDQTTVVWIRLYYNYQKTYPYYSRLIVVV